MDCHLPELAANHILLPPKLPGREDPCVTEIEEFLRGHLLAGIRTFERLARGNLLHKWDPVRLALQTCGDLNHDSMLRRDQLLAEFKNFDARSFLILHVSQQNAGVVVQRDDQ